MFNIVRKSIKIGELEVTLEQGRFARQAAGAVLVSAGETQILVTVVAAREASPNQSFFPLSVDYTEKFYAAGRIPGGYIKRETRPSEREILVSRLIDRPIRPLFPEHFLCETQVIATVLSADPNVPSAPLAMVGASAALHISDIPFKGPVGAVRIALKEGKFFINPSESVCTDAQLDLVVAGTQDGILMVEAGAQFVSEDLILEAISEAHKHIKSLCALQNELRKEIGIEKRELAQPMTDETLAKALEKQFAGALEKAYQIPLKSQRRLEIAQAKSAATESLLGEAAPEDKKKMFDSMFEDLCYKIMRRNITKKNNRIDGRKCYEIRPIDCQIGVLKRAHGSALFTRGETQSLGVVTLGTSDDVQRSESLLSVLEEKHFMLHYNMPGYSVGEPKRSGAPGRREVGHGALAERALRGAMPNRTLFPYTVRVVSEITESNGSSSMASVCSGTMALLHAGVPISKPIAGIAMGLVLEKDSVAVLSDILGDEDNLGDMDFKVAGSETGVTAMQMDMKIDGITIEILKKALFQAQEGRLHILKIMKKAIGKANDLSDLAPRIEQIKVKPERVRDLIGPGGKNIKKIVAETGCKLDIDDNGIVSLASTNGKAAAQAKRMIQYITSDPEIGQIYLGIIKKVADFGAFVEIKPGVEGLVHISQLAPGRVNSVEEVVSEGEEVMVKVIEVDRSGRIKLSRKDAIGKQQNDLVKAWLA